MTSITNNYGNDPRLNTDRDPHKNSAAKEVSSESLEGVDLGSFSTCVAKDSYPKDTAAIASALAVLNEILQKSKRKLMIDVDVRTGVVVFRVVNADTGSTVFQIPSPSGVDVESVLLNRRGLLVDISP